MALSGSGFLNDVVVTVRQMVNEPTTNPKYSDADMIGYLRRSIAVVMADINANMDHPVVTRGSLVIAVDKQSYTLPPQVGKLYYIAKINSTTGTKEWEILPGSLWDFTGFGFRLEGNTLRLLSKWKVGYTVEYAFVPNAEPFPHKANAAAYTTTTMTLATAGVDGTLDTRPEAYAGYLLRVLSSTDATAVYPQDRIISAYNNQTRVATVTEAFSPALVGTITYEVVPLFSQLLQHVWCLYTAKTILGLEGANKKYALINDLYQSALRALRITMRKEFRVGQVFEGRTPENSRNPSWAFGVMG